MAINPAIALGVRGVEVQDPLTQYSRVAVLQSAQQQNALAQMQMQQAQTEMEERNKLREFLPTLTSENRNELLKYGAAGRQVYESMLKGEKETREAEKASADVAAARMKQARDLLPSVNSPEAYANWRAYTLQNLPGLANVIPQQYSPETTRNLMLEADKALEQHFVSQNLNGAQRVLGMSKYGQGPAQVVAGSEAQVSMTPGEAERIRLESQRIGLEGQRIGLEGRRVAVAEEESKRKGAEGISTKERQAREAAFPKATTAIKGFEAESNELISDLERLKNHPGLSNITGVIAGRTPSLTAQGRAAQALYDKIIAKGGFQSLQDIRNASPTGGALGSISNQEGQQLKAAFSEIDQKMDAPDVRNAIDRTIQKIENSRNRVREGYDLTYEYRTPSAPAAGNSKPSVSNW